MPTMKQLLKSVLTSAAVCLLAMAAFVTPASAQYSVLTSGPYTYQTNFLTATVITTSVINSVLTNGVVVYTTNSFTNTASTVTTNASYIYQPGSTKIIGTNWNVVPYTGCNVNQNLSSVAGKSILTMCGTDVVAAATTNTVQLVCSNAIMVWTNHVCIGPTGTTGAAWTLTAFLDPGTTAKIATNVIQGTGTVTVAVTSQTLQTQ